MLNKISFSLLFSVAVFTASAEQNVLTIEGQYQRKNLYVSNSLANSGVGYCAYEVRVNGEITSDQVNSSAFEIDLSQLNLDPGAPVIVQIMHKDGCAPKVLNPLVLRPQATFKINEINISEEGLLKWSATNESGSLPYIIEVYKWNKWVKVGEVQGNGDEDLNSYSFKITPISGLNKVRVSQKGNMGAPNQSQPVEFNSKVEKPTWAFDKKTKKITFSKDTAFEIFDKYGQARIKGYGGFIDVGGLKDDEYYLCYDNFVEPFHKK